MGASPRPSNNNVTNTLPARVQPSGRHFKPFDHRKMNPMEGIREDSGQTEPIYQRTIVQKSPHLPSEVRHTNYNNGGGLVNPLIMEHRDSANFSMASSSDSG